ncbi:hypothetical protein KPL78_18400 [Roseomonas sp. HJA6]|uniref:Outer membrane protein beta-barrel domain-containing protein n=1 Tax=Roseomonas alba TaxID=2846776 RepID=A0ABS7AC10_9PROT|nr:hypothetical protein [Neoroseomonas alba]MBW6399836.1 hypothetical protein [Neoroseomonas alba]
MRLHRPILAALLTLAAIPAAQAQGADERTGWSVQIGLYGWAPTFNGRLNYSLPGNRGGTAAVKAESSNYLDDLNAALMMMAEVRYDRISVVTDIIYVDLGSSSTRFGAVNPGPLAGNPISSTQTLNADSSLEATVWTLAAGYTLARGGWGNFDVVGGFRLLNMDAHTNFSLAADVTGPGGRDVVLGRSGRLSGSTDIWNGVVGVRGRVLIGDSGFFVPYYFDLGTGDSRLTWQVFSGIGYQTGWAGVQLGYRYLSFDQGNQAMVDSLSMGGAYLAVNFTF